MSLSAVSPAKDEALQRAISSAADALLAQQKDDGHWVFELEADATIPAEYILYTHYLDERDPALEAKIGVYLRDRQAEHGGWPLFHGGEFNISASVKAYFALKSVLCVGGSWITPKSAVEAKDWATIERLAQEAAQLST